MNRSTRLWAVFVCLALAGCGGRTRDTPETGGTAVISSSGSETPASRFTPSRIPEVTPTTNAASPTAPANPSATPAGVLITHLPPNTELAITWIQMDNASNGWAIGGTGKEGHILTTRDGGMTWRDVTPPQTINPELKESGTATALFLDEATAWVTYAIPILDEADFDREISPIVWFTRDAGQDWTASQPLDFGDLVPRFEPYWFHFADDRHGWLMTWLGVGLSHDYVAFFRTEDGGFTWSRLFGGDQSEPGVEQGDLNLCCKTGVDFLDANTGLITLRGIPIDQVYVDWTHDGGITWEGRVLPPPATEAGPLETPGYFCGAYSPTLFSPSTAAISVRCSLDDGLRSFLYTTTDGGDTWRSRTYPGGDLEWATTEIGWALDSEIYKTIDGGENWRLVKTMDWRGQFSFIGEDLAWAVARNGDEIALVMTINGGETWQELKPRVTR